MFTINEAKPIMFNILQELDKITVELERAAVKFREADELYGGNLVDIDIQEGAMCGKLLQNQKSRFSIKRFKCCVDWYFYWVCRWCSGCVGRTDILR